ncbi:MAG: hypothetical protein ACK46M_19485, partial [Planctomyces sp.]
SFPYLVPVLVLVTRSSFPCLVLVPRARARASCSKKPPVFSPCVFDDEYEHHFIEHEHEHDLG